jgi:asparagine synthase (glutamine-hydrolysing)
LAKGFLAHASQGFEERYKSYMQVFSPNVVAELLKEPGGERYDAIAAAFEHIEGSDALNCMMAVDMQTQLPDDLLLLTDKMSMATSLECRVPLLDHELVELASRIPESVKIRGGHLKHIMKSALSHMLPADILDRKKRGFGTPMGAWLKRDLKPLLSRVLDAQSVGRRGLFQFDAIRSLIEDHEANRIDGTDQLLSLLNLEVWSRIYLDRRSSSDVAAELKSLLA